MADPVEVNIGTSENPVWVDEDMVSGQTPQGRRFWNGVASGSVVLPDDVLDKLLNTPDEKTP